MGNSPFPVRVRKSVRLGSDELKSFRKFIDAYPTVIDAADDIQLARGTVYRIYNKGVANSVSLGIIRQRMSTEANEVADTVITDSRKITKPSKR